MIHDWGRVKAVGAELPRQKCSACGEVSIPYPSGRRLVTGTFFLAECPDTCEETAALLTHYV